MAFNATEYLAALEPPSLVLDGETYTGRLLSIEEVAPFLDRLDDTSDFQNQIAAIREFCDAIEIPSDKVVSLPFPVMTAAVQDFLGCLLRVGGVK